MITPHYNKTINNSATLFVDNPQSSQPSGSIDKYPAPAARDTIEQRRFIDN
jgi:hypothetical protein